MPSITSANAVNAIPKLVAAQALPALHAEFVMAALVNVNYSDELAQYGDTVNVAIPPTLVANNIIESGTVQTQNPSLGNAQIVLDTHAEASFFIPDITAALVRPDLMMTYMQPAVIALATRIETDILDQYALFTTNTPVGGTSAMDESRIDAAETTLFNAFVPDTEPKYLVVSGTAYGQSRQIPRFTEHQTSINENQVSPLQSGRMVGQVKSFTMVRSQLVPKVGGTTYNLAFARNALALVVRRLPIAPAGMGVVQDYMSLGGFGIRATLSYQPNQLGMQVTLDTFYGVGPLRQSFAVLVETN
jgi:hypothetical protein